MKNLVIYGWTNNLSAKLIEAINRDGDRIRLIGIVHDRPKNLESQRIGYPVLGRPSIIPELLVRHEDLYFYNNIHFTPEESREADRVLSSYGCRFASLVHPDIDLNRATLGQNCQLSEGTILGPDVVIGHHFTCRLGSVISHDVTIEDYVYVSPGVTICGSVRLREGSDIGAGATILPDVTIGKNTIVGAGAVVTSDLPDDVTAVGVPAKIVRRNIPNATAPLRRQIGSG